MLENIILSDFFSELITYYVYISLLLQVMLLTYIGSLMKYSIFHLKDGHFRYLHETKNIYSMTMPTNLTIYHISALLLISFVVGVRYNVGVDWPGYKEMFEALSYDKSISFNDQSMEWGYFAINRWIANLGGSYSLMFFVVAFIAWFFIFKSVPVKLLPLSLFFVFADEIFFWSMNGVRQFVAIGIFLYSLKFIIKRNLLIYILLIVCAALFHASAVLLIPLYFVPFQKLYNQAIWMIAFIVSLLISLFYHHTLGNYLMNGLEYFFAMFLENPLIFTAYLDYIDQGKVAAQELSLGLGFVFRIMINLFILFLSKDIVKKQPETKIYFVLFFAGAIAFNLFYDFQLINRFFSYFIFIRPIVLAFIIYQLWQCKKTAIFSVGVVLLYFILYLATIYGNSNLCNPYNFSILN